MASFADGQYSRVLVAVHTASGSMLLEYKGSYDGLLPLRTSGLSDDATSFEFGNLDGDRLLDAAVVAGGKLFVLRGNSRRSGRWGRRADCHEDAHLRPRRG